jgi:branched-chain amino acid transport system permease protein
VSAAAATPATPAARSLRAAVAERWYVRALLGAAFVSLILAAAIWWIDWAGTSTDKRVALTFLVNLVGVIGLQAFIGTSGIVSFGHVAFVGLGAYTSAILTTPPEKKALSSLIPDAPGLLLDAHLSVPLATLVAVAFVMLFALVVGIALVRLSGAAAAIATLSLLVIVRVVLGNLEDITRGPKTWFGVPEYTTLGTALTFAVIAIVVARLYRESPSGLRLRSSRTDELASRGVGVDVARDRLAAWVLSAGVAAACGVLYAHMLLSFAPQTFFLDLTFLLITMAIVGGPTISGAVVGAGLITVVTEFLRRRESGFSLGPIHVDEAFGLTTIVLGLIVLAIVIVRPQGLLGRWEADEWMARGVRRLRRRGAAAGSREEVGATGARPQDRR